MKFIIWGRLPSLNEYIEAERANRFKAAKMKKDLQERIGAEIRAANLKKAEPPVKLFYVYYEPNKRRDKDNIAAIAHKFVQDSLVSCGILENDGWNDITGFTDEFFIDKKNPRIEVFLIRDPMRKDN